MVACRFSVSLSFLSIFVGLFTVVNIQLKAKKNSTLQEQDYKDKSPQKWKEVFLLIQNSSLNPPKTKQTHQYYNQSQWKQIEYDILKKKKKDGILSLKYEWYIYIHHNINLKEEEKIERKRYVNEQRMYPSLAGPKVMKEPHYR